MHACMHACMYVCMHVSILSYFLRRTERHSEKQRERERERERERGRERVRDLPLGLNGLCNVLSSEILQTQCFQHFESKEKFNSVTCIHRSLISPDDSLFLVFLWGVSVFLHRFQGAPKVPSPIPLRRIFPNRRIKRTLSLCERNPHITKPFHT